jgi:hypothetical protein
MTTVQIILPDGLAREAEQAGLLAPEAVARLLSDQLKAKRGEQLFQAMERMSAEPEPPVMTPEEVADEIAAIRAELRAQRNG